MLEDHLKISVTRDRLRSGPAAPYIDDFADWLHRLGFTPITIDFKLRCLASWTDWVRDAGFTAANISEGFEASETAVKQSKRKHYTQGLSKRSLVAAITYIRFLKENGVLASSPALPCPLDEWPILREFRNWSEQHRGLRVSTLDLYQDMALDFIKALGDQPQLYTAKSIRNFVMERAKPHGIWRAKGITTSVRAFLRFLGGTGKCETALIYAVPTFASHQLQSVPRYIEPSDVKRVIDACVSNDANGLRDRAVILLLARLGLRASDVAHLTFKDIDWKNGKIALCGKGRRHEWLPLPQDIGDAILKYIQSGRPPLKIEQIFTKVDAPLGPLTRATVTHIARSALRRAKIKAPINGAHVFRHSAATAMLREGVSLSGVGAVLRHRSPSTTAFYAKVDLGLLSQIAQAWPEVYSC